MSFPRSLSVARWLRAAFVSRSYRKQNLIHTESPAENLLEGLVLPQSRFLSLFSSLATVAALFTFAGTAQASFSYTASPAQSPANPVETGEKVIYTLTGLADGNGVTKVDIFINVDGSNQTSSFASENPNCTFTAPFFTCQSLSPFSNEIYRFSWDAPVGTSNIEFEAFCEHTDESACTGGTTSTSTQAVDPSPGVLAFSSQSLTVNEGDGSFSVTVTRSGGDAGTASIDIATADGTAIAGSDYTATSTTLSWVDGESGSKSFQVSLIDDSTNESDEGLDINLSNAQGASLGSPAQASITIEDDDAPPGELSVDNSQLTVNEDVGNATLTVSRVNGSAGTVSLTITAVSGGTATNSVDYLFSSGVLQWADGEEGPKSIVIGIVDDNLVESDETIPLQFDVAEFQIANNNVTMTIVDNDSVPGTVQFVSSEASVNEADGTVSVQVSRTDGSTGAATVNVSSTSGSATAGSDYTAVSSLVSWADGESGEKTVEISILDDLLIEGSETIGLELSGVTGAALGSLTTSTVTINDDDEVGTLQISSIPSSVGEGDGSFNISVSREGNTQGVAQVSVDTSGSAAAGSDYSADTTLLSWADGESGVKNVVVTLIDDSALEGEETLSVQLSNAQGADLGSPVSATVTIQDNEIDLGSVQFDAASVSVNENDGTATLSVNRIGSAGAATVSVGASGGSATSGDDYDFSSTTLSWADGESGSKSFTVSLINDDSAEESETLILNLSNPSDGLSLGAISSVTMTIQDDDGTGLNPIEQAMKDIANGDPQQEAVAQSIATICPQGVAEPQLQSDCNALVGSALSADGSANTEASLVLQQITVDDAGAAVEVSESGVANQQRNLVSRLNALRGGARGLDLSGLNFNIDGKNLSTAHLPSHWVKPESERGGSAGDDESSFFGDKVGVFIGGTISVGDKDKTDNEDGFEFETQGLTLGVDYRMTEQTILGAALGYTRIDTDIDNNGGSLDTDGISLSLYGTSYQSDQFFVEGIMTFGKNDFDQQRNINYTLSGTSVSQVASSDYDGDQFSLALGGGYHFQYSEVTLTTTGRVEYVDTTVDSYNESMSNPNTDGGGWGVALDEQTMDSLTLTLGVDASYAVSRSWGILSPQASIEWVHEFEDDSRLISASFVGDPTQDKFLLPTDSVDSDYFNLRLGVSGQFVSGGSAYVYYQKLLGYDDLDVDSIGLGFRWAF